MIMIKDKTKCSMQNDMYSIKCTQLIQHHLQKRLPLRCILCRAKVSRMLLFLNFVTASVKRWSVQVFRMFFFPQTGSTDQARPTRGTKWCQRRATVAQVWWCICLIFFDCWLNCADRDVANQDSAGDWDGGGVNCYCNRDPPRSVSGYNLGGSYISSSGSSYSFTSGIIIMSKLSSGSRE